jgi:hypothetical protein
MGIRWRLSLVAILAAAVLGGLVPHGVVAGTETSATQMVQALERPLTGPINCVDATCGKAAPTPTAPSPGVALAAVLGALAVVAAAAAGLRRRARGPAALPAGTRDPLFHPPQFS